MDQDDFVTAAKKQLDSWNAEIKKMQAEAEKMQAQGQEEMKKQLAQMEEQRDKVKAQLEQAGEANKAAMQDMQAGFQEAWKSLEQEHDRGAQALFRRLTARTATAMAMQRKSPRQRCTGGFSHPAMDAVISWTVPVPSRCHPPGAPWAWSSGSPSPRRCRRYRHHRHPRRGATVRPR